MFRANAHDRLSDFDVGTLAADVLRQNDVLYEKITATLECVRDEVQIAFEEVLRFLFLVASHDSGQLTPSHRVDLVWHEFILCTRVYDEFCETHFGRMIHHHPGGERERHRRQYEETLRLYKHFFGQPHQRFWPDARSRLTGANCGACETV